MIEVKNLYYSYKKNNEYAVNGISFAIAKGEIFGFLGPSGAGKSTAQGILSGLLELQKGELIFDGKLRLAKPDKAFFNRIGVGFEIPNVYKKLSGLDNLKFHARLYDKETEDPLKILEMVGLRAEADKKAGSYSKGMMQRLGFARSMINKPDIWFLDEPTMGLDPTTANSIKGIIRKKQQEGTTIFLTTHNMFAADELCNRVGFIVDGKIVAIDTPKNLKLKYGQPTATIEYLEDNVLKSKEFGLEGPAKDEFQKFIGDHQIKTVHSGEPTLEEIFIKLTGRGLE
ncbi:ABC transporter ATP-binding protein [Patescibacteria group bacterium]|nr:ABC transporter ATP-binding protein [Patescibacteria group bacterium]